MIAGKIKNISYNHLQKRRSISALASFLLVILLSGPLSAQTEMPLSYNFIGGSIEKSLIDERVLLKTDRELYLCGEEISFSAFTFEGNWFIPVSLSSVLYVELYSQDYRVISKGKFMIRDGRSIGKILIPRTISTDYYYLRAYTRYMQNFGANQFFMQRLRIINPFFDYRPDTTNVKAESERKDILTSSSPGIKISLADINDFPLNVFARHKDFICQVAGLSADTSRYLRIPRKSLPSGLISTFLVSGGGDTIKGGQLFIPPFSKAGLTMGTEKRNFGKREEVKLSIHASDGEGKPLKANLSMFVSLSKGEPQDENSFFENEIIKQEMAYAADPGHSSEIRNIEALKYLPETRGDIISGRLLYRDRQPAAGVELLQSFVGKSSCVESCTTGKDGSFIFLADDDSNTGDLVLKPVNPGRETTIIMDDEFYPDFRTVAKEIIHLSKEDLDLIEKQFVNIQVNDAFTAGNDNKPSEPRPDAPPFYGDFYKEYRFSDYARLPNMKEFIFEIIEGVVSARENRQDVINILDERTFSRIGPDPLLIIDGVPVSDASVITGLDPEKVQYVRVVRNRYFYKNRIFDGILDIITRNGDATSFEMQAGTLRYNFMRTAKNDDEDTSLTIRNENDTKPVYRNLLFRKSNISTDKDGNASVSFLTPDNSGTYVIECFGLTPDKIAIEGKAFITVGGSKPE